MIVIYLEFDEEVRVRVRVFIFIFYLGVREIGCCGWIEEKGDEEDLYSYNNKNFKRL